MRRAAALLAALLMGGCASALPPLAADSALLRTDAPADPAIAAERMLRAQAAFDRRPDRDAVRTAADLATEAALAAPRDSEPVILAVRALVWLATHRTHASGATAIAQRAVETAQACGAREPTLPACDYWLALAVGVQADIRRSTALDGLDVMVRLLRASIAAAPDLDHAGPYRVLARVLVNAPGWPAGPGDPDEGVALARTAVEMAPGWAPNHLALGEALREVGNPSGARTAYEAGLATAHTAREAGNPDAAEWIEEATRALSSIR